MPSTNAPLETPNNPLPKYHETAPYLLQNRMRFITAASLFDGHDASINIMRRILQASGAEVIHLGHNRSVQEIVQAAIQEDAQAIAISSYQGGHIEFFKYMVDLLKQHGSPHIKIFGGGGGTITPSEIATLEQYGVAKIYSPEDGRTLGLQGIINHMLKTADCRPLAHIDWPGLSQFADSARSLAQALTCLEYEGDVAAAADLRNPAFGKFKASLAQQPRKGVVIGMTGTGGAGKSSLTDELILRLLAWDTSARIAVLAIDPTRRKTGGALLGDRLRMNTVRNARVFMRSFATREANVAVSRAAKDGIDLLRRSGFDWIFLETGGTGQSDTSILDIVDLNVYVMTSEFGAPTQLEKINMLDYAHLILINKFEKAGSLDALTEVKKIFRRSHREFEPSPADRYPVIGTIASRFGDSGVDAACRHLMKLKSAPGISLLENPVTTDALAHLSIVPRDRALYLSEIVKSIRDYKRATVTQMEAVKNWESLRQAASLPEVSATTRIELTELAAKANRQIDPELSQQLAAFPSVAAKYEGDHFQYLVRDVPVNVPQTYQTLSQKKIRKVVPPICQSGAELTKFLRLENLPGQFPFTAGVYPFKRTEEDPKRMFAGEGTPERTNRRFHLLCAGEKAKRLSTAFDSVTLYGQDPDERPDIYGKIGESGVNICTLDDMKKLYAGFDLCDPTTSVSMTINGPAPMILAFFFNTAIDQRIDLFEKSHRRAATVTERQTLRAEAMQLIRGTVQADILKEDQAQNTCIFSTEFALRMMGDIQDFFIKNQVKNYYSVSISGYHIAEAGANPISQLAFTLANGFTFLEYYRSRGMNVDDFAPNFSFFFSNGLDPEYTAIGRVARRVWAIAMKHVYGANERSQKLKYHIQTSGRSLHAQEIQFNDVRTTLQALLAVFDNCNSLHTNAYDEAVTTPTAESVRRAMAIQLILSKEFGWGKNENPLQGSYFVEELTELVEEAVLTEFERISARGGVLGAMETQYQRSQIQEESLYYERLKHSGEFPIVGVNTYLNATGESPSELSGGQLTRATTAEKQEQIASLKRFKQEHAGESGPALAALQAEARSGGNLFSALLSASRVCSLGQMTQALNEVGGEYRRSV